MTVAGLATLDLVFFDTATLLTSLRPARDASRFPSLASLTLPRGMMVEPCPGRSSWPACDEGLTVVRSPWFDERVEALPWRLPLEALFSWMVSDKAERLFFGKSFSGGRIWTFLLDLFPLCCRDGSGNFRPSVRAAGVSGQKSLRSSSVIGWESSSTSIGVVDTG